MNVRATRAQIADRQTTTFLARFGAPSPLLLTLAIASRPTAAIALLALTTLLWATVELAHPPTAVALVVAGAGWQWLGTLPTSKGDTSDFAGTNRVRLPGTGDPNTINYQQPTKVGNGR